VYFKYFFGLYGQLKTEYTDVSEKKHLRGQHDQRTHGRKKGRTQAGASQAGASQAGASQASATLRYEAGRLVQYTPSPQAMQKAMLLSQRKQRIVAMKSAIREPLMDLDDQELEISAELKKIRQLEKTDISTEQRSDLENRRSDLLSQKQRINKQQEEIQERIQNLERALIRDIPDELTTFSALEAENNLNNPVFSPRPEVLENLANGGVMWHGDDSKAMQAHNEAMRITWRFLATPELPKGATTFGQPYFSHDKKRITVLQLRYNRGRPYAIPGKNEIHLPYLDEVPTHAHEIGHVLEFRFPQLGQRINDYYQMRTRGEANTQLSQYSSGYDPSEVTRIDQWGHPYMGKVYDLDVDDDGNQLSTRPTELLSTFLQAVADPFWGNEVLQDVEFVAFMIDTLGDKSLFRSQSHSLK
jgi:hypothetical protein